MWTPTDPARGPEADADWDDWDSEGESESEGDWDPPDRRRLGRLTRRSFLGAAGVAGAALAGAGPVAAVVGDGRGGGRDDRDGGRGGDRSRDRDRDRDRPGDGDGPGRFSRIFAGLTPFAAPGEELSQALVELGRPGGILDANDALAEGPIRLITELELSANNPNNPNQTAGTTFVGQFIDHDITRDAGSPLGRPLNLRRSTNLRTPRIDLDSVYGGGPTLSPELYAPGEPVRFLVESGGQFEDLPRDGNNRAIIADPRNDENMMISGLQVAMLLFHNAVAEQVEAGGLGGIDAFNETQRLVRWHWQWTVLHEYLPQIAGQQLVDDVVGNGPRFYNPNQVQIPVEFQGAAYRFGHSMVRPSYRANLAGDNGEPFFAFVFDADQLEGPDPASLLGGYRAPRRFIGWQTFFDFGDGEVKPNKKIDTAISTPLFRLPTFTIDGARAEDPGPVSLATRNLLRQVTWELPSGQALAGTMGTDVLAPGDLADLDGLGANLTASTPLWFYLLREAEVMADGLTLGPVGGRIVTEVLVTLLRRDPTSFLGVDPAWRPTLPSAAGGGQFRMTDLLRIAGVDPASRGQ